MKLQTFMLVCVFMHCMETVKIPRLTIPPTSPWAADGNYPAFKAKVDEVKAKKKDEDEVFGNAADLVPPAFYLTFRNPHGHMILISMVKVGPGVFATLKECIHWEGESILDGFHPSWVKPEEGAQQLISEGGIKLTQLYEDHSFVYLKYTGTDQQIISLADLEAKHKAPILKDKIYTEGYFWEDGLEKDDDESQRGLVFRVDLPGPIRTEGVTRGGHPLLESCGAGLYSFNALGFTELIGLVVPNAHQPLGHGVGTVMGNEKIKVVLIGPHIARYNIDLRKRLGINLLH